MTRTKARAKRPRGSAGAVHVLVDPDADFGKAKHRWPFFKESLEAAAGGVTAHFIANGNTAERCVQAALAEGAAKLAVFGDDATLNRAVNELMRAPEARRPPLAVLASSSHGQGFFHSLRPESPRLSDGERLAAAVRMAVQGKARAVDLGAAEFETSAGGREERYFLNMASYGVSGRIAESLPDGEHALHSGLAYIAASVKALMHYRAPTITLRSGRKQLFKNEKILNLFVANGRFGSGGMRVAPDADLRDGALDVLAIPDAPVSELMMELPKLWLQGKSLQGVQRFSGADFSADASPLPGIRESLRLELDGVLAGCLPARFRVKPGALRVLA